MKMYYIDTKSDKASENFAYEYYFASEKHLKDSILLLWSTVPTVMAGKYQIIPEEINTAYAESSGIEIIRRLSGGGTIYTDKGTLQFSVIEDGEKEISFEKFMSPVAKALRDMGADAEIDGRNDIILSGRKISGNAQYKVKSYTVHHGSLLFDADIGKMEKALSLPEYKILSKGIKSVRSRVINLKDRLPGVENIETFAEIIKEHFTPLEEYVPTEEDLGRIREIEKEMFSCDIYEMIKTGPAFDIEKAVKLSGGNVIAGLKIKKGIITDASVHGDFFSESGTEKFEKALIGKPYTKEGILSAALESGFSAYNIDPEELAGGLS